MVAVDSQIGLEAAGMVLVLVVRLDHVGLVLADDVRAVFAGQTLDLSPRGVGMRVEDADDLGDVFVGEARVLLAYSAWVEDILGG